MMGANWHLFTGFAFFIIMVVIAGLYCILVTRNLMRVLIGLELLTKAVTLLIIIAGYVTGYVALAQSLVITLIIIEVVVMAVTAGIILSIYRHNESLAAANLRSLKG
ncbi:MAG: NADH-quinone oxidoreductase subunit K [Candidatus Omnitrophota bacterium]|nr:NADH-quinone oxidoreductase subunit K [Candidatus Omnitrophota bacterium]